METLKLHKSSSAPMLNMGYRHPLLRVRALGPFFFFFYGVQRQRQGQQDVSLSGPADIPCRGRSGASYKLLRTVSPPCGVQLLTDNYLRTAYPESPDEPQAPRWIQGAHSVIHRMTSPRLRFFHCRLSRISLAAGRPKTAAAAVCVFLVGDLHMWAVGNGAKARKL